MILKKFQNKIFSHVVPSIPPTRRATNLDHIFLVHSQDPRTLFHNIIQRLMWPPILATFVYSGSDSLTTKTVVNYWSQRDDAMSLFPWALWCLYWSCDAVMHTTAASKVHSELLYCQSYFNLAILLVSLAVVLMKILIFGNIYFHIFISAFLFYYSSGLFLDKGSPRLDIRCRSQCLKLH